MFKKFVSVVLVILLTNLLLGEYSILFAQDISFHKNSGTNQLSLKNIKNSRLLVDSIPKNNSLVLNPVSANDLIPQFLTGLGLSAAAIFTTLIVTVPLFNMKFDVGGGSGNTSSGSAFLFLSVLIAVQVFSTAGSVWMAGTKENVGGNFGFTLLGTVAGVGLEIGGFALASNVERSHKGTEGNSTLTWIIRISSLTLPTIGAMVGFNSSRYPKRVKNNNNSLLNLERNKFVISSPEVFIEKDKTFRKNPVTFTRLVSINF